MQEQRAGRKKRLVERLSSAGLRPHEADVRKAILRAFAAEGKAPRVQELAHRLGLPVAPVIAACRTLAAHDLIVWKEDTRHISSAYPFSGVPTAHQVLLAEHTASYAMCAIDALGIPCMLGQGARICSMCFFCHTPVIVDIDGGVLSRSHPSTLVVWDSDRDGSCVAEVRCPLTNFFCNAGHLQEWRATALQERGTCLSLAAALAVGKAAFGALLA
jgi:hypothetical protein